MKISDTWTLWKNSIYTIKVPTNLNYQASDVGTVFSNNEPLTVARSPDTGFYKISQSFADGFADSSRTEASK